MLEDPATWKKWSSRDQAKSATGRRAVAAADHRDRADLRAQAGRLALHVHQAGGDWARPGFDDSEWKQGPGGFGTTGTPGAVIGTTWDTPDIWLRREVTLPAGTDPSRIQLRVYHDEDVEIYIDGVLAARQSGYVTRL